MRMRRTLAFIVFGCVVLFAAIKNRAAEVHGGDWTISKSDTPGKVEFSLIEHHHGGMSNHHSDWPASSFPGVDFSKSGRQDVHFTIARDAGKIDCEGFLNDGEGAGLFNFQPDSNYPARNAVARLLHRRREAVLYGGSGCQSGLRKADEERASQRSRCRQADRLSHLPRRLSSSFRICEPKG